MFLSGCMNKVCAQKKPNIFLSFIDFFKCQFRSITKCLHITRVVMRYMQTQLTD